MTWHADETLLRSYGGGELPGPQALSVDAHLLGCADCRRALAELTDPAAVDRSWARVVAKVDRTSSPVDRLLDRVHLTGPRWRVAALTAWLPQRSLLAMIAAVASLAVLALARDMSGDDLYAYLVIAPLVPLAAVAGTFSLRRDPLGELVAAAPMPTFEVLLVRTCAVLGVTTLALAACSLALPHGWLAVGWLLPAFGLSAVALAVATWVPAGWAAGTVGGAWCVAGSAAWIAHRADGDVLDQYVALQPAGQLAFAVMAVIATAVLLFRRQSLELGRTT